MREGTVFERGEKNGCEKKRVKIVEKRKEES